MLSTRFYDFPMSNLIKNIFDDVSIFNAPNNNFGAVNVRDNEDKVIIEFNVPGVKKENINIKLDDGTIEVSSEYKESTENYSRKEFSSQSFCRKFKLPEDVNVNDITAKNVDGILEITMNKKKIEKPIGRVIEIK